jgi:hypothetical protein
VRAGSASDDTATTTDAESRHGFVWDIAAATVAAAEVPRCIALASWRRRYGGWLLLVARRQGRATAAPSLSKEA